MPLLLLNKPFRVLSRFSDCDGRLSLAHFVSMKGIYPAGRLDRDSEGLLLLTDDGRLQARIASPASKLAKHYWVQVEGDPMPEALDTLRTGVVLKDGPARALTVRRIDTPPALWPRDPPIRVRRTVPDAWLELVIDEGRNRQVRRMTAAVGLPTLRLIRHRIGPWAIDGLAPGETRLVERESAWQAVKRYAC